MRIPSFVLLNVFTTIISAIASTDNLHDGSNSIPDTNHVNIEAGIQTRDRNMHQAVLDGSIKFFSWAVTISDICYPTVCSSRVIELMSMVAPMDPAWSNTACWVAGGHLLIANYASYTFNSWKDQDKQS